MAALERDAYDFRLGLTASKESDPRIVIIDIDERSLLEVGQWPWPRAQIAQLVGQLFNQYHVDTLGMDVVFAEPEAHFSQSEIESAIDQEGDGGPQSLEQFLMKLSAQKGDQKLATVISKNSVVLGYIFENGFVDSVGVLPTNFFSPLNDQKLISWIDAPKVQRYTGNIDLLQNAASGAGFFTLAGVTDPDGIIRRVALLNQHQEKLYGALPLVVTQQFLGMNVSPLINQSDSVDGYAAMEGLDLGVSNIPLDAQSAVYVPYRHPADRYRYQKIPAWKVLAGEAEGLDVLDGTIVLLGASAAGLVDLRNTPLQNAFPGVEIHATLISALLDGGIRSQPAWTQAFELILVLVLGLVLSLWLPRLAIAQSTLWTGFIFGAVLISNAYFWTQAQWIVPIATISVLIWLIYSLNTLLGFFNEARSRQIMRSMFGLYVPEEIVDEMSVTPDVYSLKSEKREMSVMFSDVRGFTTISEQLTPEALSELLNTLLTPVTEIIHHNHGAIDKYMGDAVMAFWGAPVKTDIHAEEAVRAALEISEKLKVINVDFIKRGWPEMQMGIGVSTGPMSVGNMGSKFRMAYTVLGDTVNLGSRLEGLTKMYGVDIIVSEATQQATPELVYQELDRVRVKGKQLPERIYQPLGLKSDLSQVMKDELLAYEDAIILYQNQQWQLSKVAFELLDAQYSRVLYGMYTDRSSGFCNKPPSPDWDGVTTLTHK